MLVGYEVGYKINEDRDKKKQKYTIGLHGVLESTTRIKW